MMEFLRKISNKKIIKEYFRIQNKIKNKSKILSFMFIQNL